MIRIDAHSHLWLKQDTTVDGKRILSLKNAASSTVPESPTARRSAPAPLPRPVDIFGTLRSS